MPDADAPPPAVTERPLAVIDVDGVVADVRHRLHFLERPRKDWDGFFAAAAQDPPLEVGIRRVLELAGDHDVVWLTGRPESLRATTLDWFAANGLPAHRLIMRRGADRRPAKVVKRGELRRLAARRQVAVVIDDDPAVVAALAADGWPVEHATWVGYTETLEDAQEVTGKT
jgi:hypothetical protein